MVLARELTERGFDIVVARIPWNTKDFVIIAVAHNYSWWSSKRCLSAVSRPHLAIAGFDTVERSIRPTQPAVYSFTSPSTTSGPASGSGFVPVSLAPSAPAPGVFSPW